MEINSKEETLNYDEIMIFFLFFYIKNKKEKEGKIIRKL